MKNIKLTITFGLRYCFGFGSLAICLLFLHLPEVIAQSKQFLPVDKRIKVAVTNSSS